MALLDVSSLLTDPDFCDTVSVARRTETVNTFGENVITESLLSITASVQRVGTRDAQTLPQGVQISDALTVYTKTTLLAGQDTLSWNGETFVVNRIDANRSHVGGGWIKCLAIKEGL